MRSARIVPFAVFGVFVCAAATPALEGCAPSETVKAGSGSAGTSGAAGTTGAAGTGTSGSAGTTGSAGTGTTGTAGTTGATGAAGTGSSGTAGAPGTAGTGTTGTAGTGTSGSAGTTGGAGTTGSAGTSGTAGTTGAAGTGSSGTAGTAGGGAFPPTPSCTGLTTATGAGGAPAKGNTCTSTDPQLCYATCGPSSIGVKSEMCMGGTYAEMSGCTFDPNGTFSCYKIPATMDASCPTTAPMAGASCSQAPCTVCNVNGMYLDSKSASKMGYCVCPMGASPKWTCAANAAWPCPSGSGC
jgi:pilus assembly protein FimV